MPSPESHRRLEAVGFEETFGIGAADGRESRQDRLKVRALGIRHTGPRRRFRQPAGQQVETPHELARINMNL
jgi:hypothetical protein